VRGWEKGSKQGDRHEPHPTHSVSYCHEDFRAKPVEEEDWRSASELPKKDAGEGKEGESESVTTA